MLNKLLIASVLIVLSISCQPSKQAIIDKFNSKVEKIQNRFLQDRSLNVFNASLNFDDGAWKIEGETTIDSAQKALTVFIDSLFEGETTENNFELLPQKQLGDSTYGIISVSVANMRGNRKHSAELVNQCIMGDVVKLLKKKGGWYLIQTDYGYIGWMTAGSFEKTDAQGINLWKKSPGAYVNVLSGFVYQKPDNKSIPLTDVVINMRLELVEKNKAWAKVETPDKKQGYILSKNITETLPGETNAENVLKTAKSMMGVPYLWGGNSSKGNDCSGFTSTVFKKNGMQLPRDARQQVLIGNEIIPDENFSNVYPGDLIFFGYNGRITHVGISLGGMDFIDQGGKVSLNSLDSTSENYSSFRKRTFKTIRRVLN